MRCIRLTLSVPHVCKSRLDVLFTVNFVPLLERILNLLHRKRSFFLDESWQTSDFLKFCSITKTMWKVTWKTCNIMRSKCFFCCCCFPNWTRAKMSDPSFWLLIGYRLTRKKIKNKTKTHSPVSTSIWPEAQLIQSTQHVLGLQNGSSVALMAAIHEKCIIDLLNNIFRLICWRRGLCLCFCLWKNNML